MLAEELQSCMTCTTWGHLSFFELSLQTCDMMNSLVLGAALQVELGQGKSGASNQVEFFCMLPNYPGHSNAINNISWKSNQ